MISIPQSYSDRSVAEMPIYTAQQFERFESVFKDVSRIEIPNEEELTNSDPDAYSTYAQICKRYGFNYATHQVTTPDGYLLTVMHVTSDSTPAGAPAVFL